MIELSLGRERRVHGLTVRKMPLGAYLRALERLRNLPGELLEAAFPGSELAAALEAVLQLNQEKLAAVTGRMLLAIPAYLTGFLAELLGCEESRLRDDPAIGPTELAEILAAFAEVNRLGELPGAAARLLGLLPTKGGSSG